MRVAQAALAAGDATTALLAGHESAFPSVPLPGNGWQRGCSRCAAAAARSRGQAKVRTFPAQHPSSPLVASEKTAWEK